MKTEFDQQLSALVDGELDDHTQELLLAEVAKDDDLRDQFLKLQLMRQAVRGQCSASYLRKSFENESDFNSVAEHTSKQPQKKQSRLPELMQNLFFPGQGRLRWAAGVSVAIAIGYFSHDLVEQQIFNSATVTQQTVAYNHDSWQFSSDNGSSRIENYLNQSLLSLGDTSSVLNLNSKTNALLVSYNTQNQ